MSDGMPTPRSVKQIIKSVHQDGRIHDDVEMIADKTGLSTSSVEEVWQDYKDRIDEPFAVVDPRYLGYSFPSYTFVETQNNLERAYEARDVDFENNQKASMLGTVLGDIDLVHRRVDEDRFANARFATRAKEHLSYFENFETYPVFQIVRWNGKDRTNQLRQEPNLPDSLSIEIIRQLRGDPSLGPGDILNRIQVMDGRKDQEILVDDPDDFSKINIENKIQELKQRDILLGYSASFDLNNSPWQSAIMGLTMESGPGDEDENHDQVVEELKSYDTDLINNFTLPYITAGVGQGWADILLEVLVEDIGSLDDIATELRSIDHVETTQTYLMTDVIFEKPFEVEDYSQIRG